MSYPAGWDLVNITGTYIARDGTPCTGSVTLSSPQLVLRSGTIVPAADIVFDLVNGTFSGQIPATDDPNAQPSGWVYTVTENVPGGRQGYQIVAPHTSPGIDLSTVIPVTMPMPPTFGFPYVTLAQLAGTAPGDGSYLIGYQNTSTGSVARTVFSKLGDIMSVLDFAGVDPTGSTDSTAGIQNAVNACFGTLLFPAGTYKCGAISITHALLLQGEGSTDPSAGSGSTIVHNSTTTNVFTVNTQYPVVFRDLIFQCLTTPTAGASITWEDTTPTQGVANLFSGCFNCRFDNVFIGIYAVSASSWYATNCVFWTIPAGGIGIQIDNQYIKDQGDQSIIGCTFLGNTTAIGIYWVGGGGTRIVSNKFLCTNAIWAQFTNTTGTATAQFLIANNSIDVPYNYASAQPVQLVCSSGTLSFNDIIITGNIFVGYYAMVQMLTIAGIAAAPIGQVSITGNNFINTAGSFSGNGMINLDYVTQFLVAHNLVLGPGSSTGIAIGSHCTHGGVVANEVQGFTTQVVNNAGLPVRVRGTSNSGAAAAVSDGGTISHGLETTPTKVEVTGSVAAQTYTVFNVTSTSFQVSVRNTGGASGSAATIYWTAEV